MKLALFVSWQNENYAFLPALRFFDLAGFLAALAFLLRFFLLAGLEGAATEITGHLITLAISFSISATALISCSFFEVILSKLRRVSLVMCLMSILEVVGNRMGLVAISIWDHQDQQGLPSGFSIWQYGMRFMRLIPTARKEKLPKGFSYPLGAEAISAAFHGVAQLDNSKIQFEWRDEYWASKWRKKLKTLGDVNLLEVGHSPLSGERVLRVFSVPSEYSVAARDHLLAELPQVRRQLLAAGSSSNQSRIVVTLSLSEAKRAAISKSQ